jgi:hypothetical protein
LAVRASLTEPVNAIGIEFIRRIYGFGRKRRRMEPESVGRPVKFSWGPEKRDRRPI